MLVKTSLSQNPSYPNRLHFVHQVKGAPNFGRHEKAWTKVLTENVEGRAGEVRIFRQPNWAPEINLLWVGLGSKENLSVESARRAVAVAVQKARDEKLTDISLHLEDLAACSKDTFALLQAIGEAIHLSLYKFDELKSKSESDAKKSTKEMQIEVVGKFSAAQKTAFEHGEIAAKHINFARRLEDLPANYKTPEMFAKAIQAHAKGTKVKVTVWDKEKIIKEKFGGLHGVSLGSDKDPRFIILEYKGGGSKAPLAYVGKGLTFDSGGISIKPADGMDELRYDMCGAGNVSAAIFAMAEMGVKQNIMGFLSVTENMPGPGANKPGDILTARNGKTMEVLNTDAEGRLVLADALSYACEQEPAFVVDAATLTGAMVIALGYTYTGYFCNDDNLNKKIQASAAQSEELIWRMPLHEEYVKEVQGTYGDIQNIGKTQRSAGSCTAAAFLQHFIAKDVKWAHFDIAGTANNTGKMHPYNPAKGGSGVMVRTFIELAKSF